jgi:hypothetical protein
MMKITKLTFTLFAFLLYSFIKHAKTASEVVDGGLVKNVQRYQVAHFDLENVGGVYVITLWIILGSLAKIGT